MVEKWKPIPGFKKYYLISNTGKVKSIFYRGGNRILKGVLNTKGYPQVRLYKNKKASIKRIHRIVAEVFIPNNKNLPQVNHKDGNKLNNYRANLEWCSNLYNARHSFNKLGRMSGRKINKLKQNGPVL